MLVHKRCVRVAAELGCCRECAKRWACGLNFARRPFPCRSSHHGGFRDLDRVGVSVYNKLALCFLSSGGLLRGDNSNCAVWRCHNGLTALYTISIIVLRVCQVLKAARDAVDGAAGMVCIYTIYDAVIESLSVLNETGS